MTIMYNDRQVEMVHYIALQLNVTHESAWDIVSIEDEIDIYSIMDAITIYRIHGINNGIMINNESIDVLNEIIVSRIMASEMIMPCHRSLGLNAIKVWDLKAACLELGMDVKIESVVKVFKNI